MKKLILLLIISVYLLLSSKLLAQVTTVFPPDGFIFESKDSIHFQYNKGGSTYQVQISTDTLFNTLILNQTTSNTKFQPTPSLFALNVSYYWRVRPTNSAVWSKVSSFVVYNPSMYSSLNMWFKSDANFHLTGGNVDEWDDLSSNNVKATQATAGNMPVYIPNAPAINHPIVNFTAASSNFMVMNKTVTYGNFTVLCLRNFTFVPGQGDAQFILAGDGNKGVLADARVIGYGYGLINGGEFLGAPVSDQTNQFSIYTYSNKFVRRNGALPASFPANTPISGLSIYNMGRRPDNQYFLNSGIAEVVGFSDTLLLDDIKKMEGYLRYKYAPPVNLGPDTIFGSGFCDTLRLNADSRYASYLWSTGDTTQTTKANANGLYWVKVKDIFGFESTDDIVVLPFERLGNRTVYVCKGDTFKIDLKLPGSYTIRWSNGVNSSKNSLYQTGMYTVNITDSKNCSYRDTINLVVNETYYSPAIINKNITICEAEKLFLVSNINIDSIAWSNGSNQKYTTFSSSGQYNVYAVTSTGCVIKDTFNVNLAGKAPIANFGFSTLCRGTPITFTDSSTIPNGNIVQNWKWTFSNGHTFNTPSPTDTFPIGTAGASLKITTNAGCSDSIFKSFTVNRKPSAKFTNLLSCSGIPTTFVDQSTANAASITDWLWDFAGLGNSHGVQNPSFRFPAPAVYNVTLTAINSNGCIDTVTIPTTVNESPISNFSFDSVCGTSPLSFKFLATATLPNTISAFNWDFGDATQNSVIRSPQHQYAQPGIYTVKLFVRSAPGQCQDTAVKQVRVFDYPVVDFSVSSTQCTGKGIQFTDISTTPDSTPVTRWNWFFSGQGTSTEQDPVFTFNTQGNYTIQLTAFNAVGCSRTKLRSIAVSAPPEPKFTFTPQNGIPPLTVTYTNQSPSSGNYIWDYGDGSGLDTAYNPPTHTYTVRGTYPIKLIGTDFRGCTDTLVKYILVDKAFLDGVMATVSISPNGDFYQVRVTIVNNSNVELTSMGLSLQLEGGAVVREDWTGSLLPGKSLDYVFIGQIKLSSNNVPVVCATIDYVNSHAHEDRTDNNTTCKEIRVGGFDVLTVFPNPAYENVNFGVMLPQDGRVTISFIDYLGQKMYSKDFDGVKGYNNLSVSMFPMNAALYIAEVYYDGVTIRKKVMRQDHK